VGRVGNLLCGRALYMGAGPYSGALSDAVESGRFGPVQFIDLIAMYGFGVLPVTSTGVSFRV
jgi:hypothetical protein